MGEAGSTSLVGARTWAIAEGYIPSASTGEGPELESHEAARLLNANASPPQVGITESDQPIAVPHTRLGSHQPALALPIVAHPA